MRKSDKDSLSWAASLGVLFLLFVGQATGNKEGYFGKYVGKLSQLHHGVSGDVFAVDARTLHIRNFNYDGEGPAAYFYAGNSKGPGVNGFRLRDERGTTNVLPRYRNKHITITLPDGKTLQTIRWFSVWCDEFSVNFGDVKIPKNLDFPKPQKISGLNGVHGVSSEPIVIVDAQTLLIPSFSYDGEAPDAKFWVGRGFKPSPQGIRIPDENGKELPLRRYDRKTIVLTLPGDLTIFDIGHFGVWCEAFTVDFGHVQIPRGLNIPPSLKMLGVSPQSKLNCEVLWDDFAYEVRWAVAGDSIVLQLVARLENNEYMSFGLSGDGGRSRMVGGDVVVAWVDKESLKGFAKDYYLDAKSQCSGGRGSCPDENIQTGADSVRLLNAALVNGYSIVTFQRSLRAQDDLDKDVLTNTSQPVIWAIGPLNSRKEVSYHSLASRGDIFIDFGRAPKWNCPTPESVSEESDPQDSSLSREYEEARVVTETQGSGRRESRPKTQIPTPAPAPKTGAWEIPSIKCYEPEDGVFYAQMGPTGGKHGYSAITGHVGWGISWYINGLLIPEINVVRGRTYTFIVEGGLDPDTPARYHPFYITDDPVGGYQHKTPEERANIQIFAGAVQNKRGEVRPTGVGRLCNWTPDPSAPPADEFTSFGAYQRTLRLECDPGNPGIIQWTVEKDTPDTVYYQCYTHRYLGWKIRVHDDCVGAAASEPVPSVVKAPTSVLEFYATDSEGSESIYHETRIKPDSEILKSALERNPTNFAANEFVSFDSAGFTLGSTQSKVKDEFGFKTGATQHRLVSLGPAAGTILQEQTPKVPQRSHTQDKKFVSFSPVYLPTKSLGYSVSEEPLEGGPHQNFQTVPVVITQQEESTNAVPIRQILHQQQPVNLPPRMTAGNKFPKEHANNYGILRPQAEEILKRNNHKLPYNGKTSNRISGGPNRLRKPAQASGLPLTAQPLSAAAIPPQSSSLKVHKRPIQKMHPPPPHHRVNVALRPESSHRQDNRLIQQIKPFTWKQQSPFFGPSDLLGSSSAKQIFTQNGPLAHSGGFDPESVQVEGGFKPILNSGTAPKAISDSVDRVGVEVAEEADDRIGVVDLTFEEGSDDKSSLGAVRKGSTDGKSVSNGGENVDKEIDLFKNLEPQMFEPIFIPSHPDNSEKKHQEKHKKKPLLSLKPRNDRFQSFDTQKKGYIHVKIRPSDNLIRRPLYPDNIVPPFRIPSQRGTPQLRSHLADDAVDARTEDGQQETPRNESASEIIRAENIMELLEKFDSPENDTDSGKDKSTNSEVVQDEVAVADERKDFYLPPGAEEFLSYDGKVVKTVEAPVFPEANPPDVSKLPQFVPFKGAIPPLTQVVNAKNLPQLSTSKLARQDILPLAGSGADNAAPNAPPNLQGDQAHRRAQRSPDHIPGHEGHDHHHDHDHRIHHDHSGGSSRAASLVQIALTALVALSWHVLMQKPA